MANQTRPALVAGACVGGKYRLVRRLGTGSMGVVWAAVNEATLSEVAVKLISGAEPEFRMRLLREARLCGQLKHRNIIDVYDVATTEEGEPFLVMQLLLGETLAQRLHRCRRLDPPEAALIARDIARALAVAHAKRIIHRDLKPANIFLQEEAAGFVVKVLDFGVSKSLAVADNLSTVVGAAIGSLPYMSPEQAQARSDVDHRADLWSVGVLLFEMLAGARPFQGSMPALLMALVRGPTPSVAQAVRGLDEGLVRVVERCLERRLDERIGSAVELALLLDPYAATADRLSWGGNARGRTSASPALPASGPPPELRQPPPALAGDDSTTAPCVPAPAYAPPAMLDGIDEKTVRLPPRRSTPDEPEPSPDFNAARPLQRGAGGTVRISVEDAAQLKTARPHPPPPQAPPPARQVDAAAPLPPPVRHANAVAPTPRGGSLLGIFVAAAAITILLWLGAYLLYRSQTAPARPAQTQEGG